MTISAADVLSHRLRDPRLATYAVSALPAWLWSSDGATVLWANSSGAAVFGHRTSLDLAAHRFGPADRHRRQVARLAMALPSDSSLRLERLQGFGAALGQLRTCACRRLIAADGTTGVLMVATEPAGRAMTYPERVQRLVDGLDSAAAFDRAGKLIAASAAAMALFASERSGEVDLSVFGLDQAAAAMEDGHVTVATPVASIDLLRLGQGSEMTWLALMSPAMATAIPLAPAEDHAGEPEPASPSIATEAALVATPPDRADEAAAATPVEIDGCRPTAEAPAPLAVAAPPEASGTAPAPDSDAPAEPLASSETAVGDVSGLAPVNAEHVVTADTAIPAPLEPVPPASPAPTLEPSAAMAPLAGLESDEPQAPTEANAVERLPEPASPSMATEAALVATPPDGIDEAVAATPAEIEAQRPTAEAPAALAVAAPPETEAGPTVPPLDRDAPAELLDSSPTRDADESTRGPVNGEHVVTADMAIPAPLEPVAPAPPAPTLEPSAAMASPAALEIGEPPAPIEAEAVEEPTSLQPAQAEPAPEAREAEPSAAAHEPSSPQLVTGHDVDDAAFSSPHEPATAPRRHPLRFVWQMDADGRFLLGVDEFARLIGPRTATAFGRPWSELAALFGLDPEGRVAAAIATRHTWSGITVNWPVDGGDIRLPVELSALPIYDRNRQFQGYRGFGMCRDLDALESLAAQRRLDAMRATPSEADEPPPAAADAQVFPAAGRPFILHSQPTDIAVETPQNVVPFRLANEPKAPTLTPVENNAFNELARQLAARLEAERSELGAREPAETAVTSVDAPASAADANSEANDGEPSVTLSSPEPAPWKPDHHAPPRAESRRDSLLYDRIPVGVLVYQLDRLLYANRAFLDRVGYSDLQSLATAGGLDALYVEPGVTGGGSTSEEGTPVRIAASGRDDLPTDARLHSILWDGETAHALIFSAGQASSQASPQGSSQQSSQGSAPPAAPEAVPAPPVSVPAPAPDQSRVDLEAVFGASDDAIFIVGRDGQILRHNDGASRLFGAAEGVAMPASLADLFAPESRDALLGWIDALRHTDDTDTPRRQAGELIGLSRDGRNVPLRLTMGQTDATGARFFLICRETPVQHQPDQSRQHQLERVATARADILATISQEIRTPLNAIIGFADVMIEERFGALANDRYAAYLRDIRASGERVLAIVNDMVDLSRAETGQLHLSLARQDLNEIVEQCVAALQPQANRERIIIRTSLAQALPPVTADGAALRQIVLNLVGNSIHVARAGGQIIVSTAVTDLGDIVLRVRDTGRGLNHGEMEAACERFRLAGADHVAQDNGINLSLTRALVEANRAQFQVKSAPHSGTLIEVAFPPLTARSA